MTNRAGSRRRVDSPVSRSDNSLDPGMGSEYDLAAPLPYAYASPPSIGPASSVSEDDLVEWRRKYSFSSSTILRIPAPEERASSFIPGQIAIYEAFFDIGFRGVIPALVASLCDFFKISPSQLNPPSWRLLVAIQNLGDLENLSFGINEVLFSYHLAPLNGNEGRLHLRPRSGLPIMEELQKGDRKGSAFSKKWQERYIFVMLSGHSYHWNFIAGTHPVLSEGEDTVVRARQLPLDRRQVPFLLSDSNMSGNTSNDPFAAYQEATKVMSAKKGSASRTVPVTWKLDHGRSQYRALPIACLISNARLVFWVLRGKEGYFAARKVARVCPYAAGQRGFIKHAMYGEVARKHAPSCDTLLGLHVSSLDVLARVPLWLRVRCSGSRM
ncbi:hypothetical protein F2Q70_00030256 [Brassica cretica]|uniref:Uncharacterized protein n=1 Tax=Brassica cretica TaxID=69181 RepID=A0A8S9FFP2_BRACR|nr:hypothetical protein F2Q70_00030256 [Brassica cretica]